MKVAISACLLGLPVRYDGGAKPVSAVQKLAEKVTVTKICPETSSGLPTPRPPAEQREGRVWLKDGSDVTEDFERGSQISLSAVKSSNITLAVLKAKSPSCGVHEIYDGTYSGNLISGEGTLTRHLLEEGICVVTEKTIENVSPSVEHFGNWLGTSCWFGKAS